MLNVYQNTSSDLLHGYEYFCDTFRNPYLNPDGFMPCSPSNNIYSRYINLLFSNIFNIFSNIYFILSLLKYYILGNLMKNLKIQC